MAKSIVLAGCLLKAESTYGTDAAPVVGTDGFRLAEAAQSWVSFGTEFAYPNERDDAVSGTGFPVAPGDPEGEMATVELAWEVRGPGSTPTGTGDLAAAGAALVACGYAESFAASTLTFTGGTLGNAGSVTIWGYGGDKLVKVTGCVGTFDWVCPAGEITLLRFTFQGLVRQVHTNVALPTISSYNTSIPPSFVNASATVGGTWSPDLVNLTHSAGVEIVRHGSGNAADGIAGFERVRHRPVTTIQAKERDISSGIDPYADARASTARALAWTAGGTSGNRANGAVAAAYARPVQPEEQESLAGWTIPYRGVDSAIDFD